MTNRPTAYRPTVVLDERMAKNSTETVRLHLVYQRRYASLLRVHLAEVRADLRAIRHKLDLQTVQLLLSCVETQLKDMDERYVEPLLVGTTDGGGRR